MVRKRCLHPRLKNHTGLKNPIEDTAHAMSVPDTAGLADWQASPTCERSSVQRRKALCGRKQRRCQRKLCQHRMLYVACIGRTATCCCREGRLLRDSHCGLDRTLCQSRTSRRGCVSKCDN
eukprot:1062798-Rhodomonas_salina.1